MSFLNKIGLKKKNNNKDVPPPPPAPNKADKKDGEDAPKAPPAPKKAGDEDKIKDLPSTKKAEKKPEPSKPSTRLPPAPSSAANKELPPVPTQQEGASEKPKPPQQQQQPAKPSAREQIRSTFNDVPPIKSSQKMRSKVTDDDVKEFDVEDFRLPGEPEPEQPAPEPEPAPEPRPSEGPLFIHINSYEDIQQRIKDVKKQVSSAEGHIQKILSEREKEDEQFSKFIEELERIQDDLIAIDEDLFEEK